MTETLTKRCTTCGKLKPWSEFHMRRRPTPRPIPSCKACSVKRTQAWKAKHPQKYLELNERRNQRNRARGESLLGPAVRCAICGHRFVGKHHKGPAFDHDHGSGKARGWLCAGCNKGLGSFGDNPALLRTALDYLKAKPFTVSRARLS